MSLSDTMFLFPKQQLPESKKTKAWYIENIKAGVNLLAYNSSSGVRESRLNKLTNYQLANNILSHEEMNRVINPWKIQGFEFPDELQNFPLLNPKADLLVGESYKRLFNPVVVAVNHDAISDKEQAQKANIMQYLSNLILSDDLDPKVAEQKLQELSKWNNWNSQDLRERMATQILQYHRRYQNWDHVFMKGFEDLLISGEEIYRTTIVSGEPVLERANPLDVITLRMGTSHKIEDSDIIIHYRRLPLGKVQDEFYEYLTAEESSKLEKGYASNAAASPLFSRPQSIAPNIFVDELTEAKDIENLLRVNMDGINAFGGAYDDQGNLKVVTVYWKTKRKVGIKTYFSPTGELIKVPVTEHYVPDKGAGEEVTWYWVSEWMEGTQLGQDIFVKMQPFAINRYGIDNFVLKTAPMVGVVANINSSKAMSLYDRAKPYQYLYNAFMHNARKAFRNSRGKMAIIDAAWIPEGWTTDQVMFYMEEMNVMWVDSFKEGSQGAARGKLAGNLSGQQREINLEMGNVIQQYMLMLNFLQSMIGEITGVSQQRQGQIQNSELVGNVERAVVQSSHITEKWFALHDQVRIKALSMFLEVAKEAYRGRKEKRAYVMDDMSGAVLDLDGDLLCEADYGVFLENGTDAEMLMRNIQNIAQAAMQNDKLTMSQAIDLLRIKSPSQLAKKFEQLEQEAIQRNQEIMQQQLEAQQQQVQAEVQLESEKLRIEEEKNLRDDETKRYIAELGAQTGNEPNEVVDNGEQHKIDLQKLQLQKEKQDADKNLKEKQLKETQRHNQAAEAISRSKKSSQK